MTVVQSFILPLYAVAAGALVVSGLAKVRRPTPVMKALRSSGLPSSKPLVLGLAGVELVLGAVCLVTPARWAAVALTALYLGFAWFLVRAMRTGDGASCGCFGEADTPPSPIHVAVDVGAALVGSAAALVALPELPPVLMKMPLAGVPFVVAAATAGYLVYLLVGRLPGVWAAMNAGRDRA